MGSRSGISWRESYSLGFRFAFGRLTRPLAFFGVVLGPCLAPLAEVFAEAGAYPSEESPDRCHPSLRLAKCYWTGLPLVFRIVVTCMTCFC